MLSTGEIPIIEKYYRYITKYIQSLIPLIVNVLAEAAGLKGFERE